MKILYDRELDFNLSHRRWNRGTNTRGGINMNIRIKIDAEYQIDIEDLMDMTLRQYITEYIKEIVDNNDIEVTEE